MEESPAVNAGIDTSLELSAWISIHHPSSFVHDGHKLLAVAFFSIALDHREAILCLLRHGARSSAFALARSLYEAGIRGSWAQYCATPDEHDRAFSNGILPGFDNMVRRLGTIKGTNNTFGRSKQMAWSALSEYAHGGMKQVIRWVGAHGVAPQHSDIETQELLYFIDMHGLLACMGIASISGMPIDAHAEKALAVAQAATDWKKQNRTQQVDA